MPEVRTELLDSEVGDAYEDVVTYTLDDPGPLLIITDCEGDTVGWAPKDKVAAITKILNWVPEKLRAPRVTDLDKSVTTALIANTYEASVDAVAYEDYDDYLSNYPPPEKGAVPLLDAEGDLVMYVPAGKGEFFARLFNWADANVPIPDTDDE